MPLLVTFCSLCHCHEWEVKDDASADNLLNKMQTNKEKTKTINMNRGYKAKHIQTIGNTVAHMTTNDNYKKCLMMRH